MELSVAEMLAEKYDRNAMLDAALDLVSQLKNQNGALRAILDQALHEAREANRELVRCNPNDADVIRELQWRVIRFDDLSRFVANVLEAGKAAYEDITDEQAAEMELLIRGDDTQLKD